MKPYIKNVLIFILVFFLIGAVEVQGRNASRGG